MSVASNWLDKYPFLRFDIPFIAGIIFVGTGKIFDERAFPAVLAGSVLILLYCAFVCKAVSYRFRWVYGVMLSAALFCAGAWRMDCRNREVLVEWNEGKCVYSGIVSGLPEEKRKTRLVPVMVSGKQVLLYLPKDSLSACLSCGDELLFYAQIKKTENRGDRTGFDYATYLIKQGVSGTAYVSAGHWRMGERKITPTWKQKALMLREKLVNKYREWGFSGNELAVISALTLGDKSELDDDLKTCYSLAGASHILALSGLHLGIVAGILSFLLFFKVGYKRNLWPRGIFILLALWTFAYVTGLSGSVVRSATMFSVFIFGICLRRKGLLLNSLSLAAFVMLLYNPYYLWDIGFQLSFMAVVGIALFMPVFENGFHTSVRFFRYLYGVIGVSLAAQLGVAPLVSYYFGSFPTYFLLTNLLVVPLSGIILVVSVAFWLVAWMPWLHDVVFQLLRFLLGLLNDSVQWVSALPGASFEVDVNIPGVLLGYWIPVCLLLFWRFRTARPLFCLLGGICVFLLFCLAETISF